MSDNQSSNRSRRAKSELTHNRSSMGSLRTLRSEYRSSMDSLRSEFRNKFFNRLRSSRSRSVDRFRQIVEDYGNNIRFKSVHDLRKVLLEDKEATNLMKTDDVNDILNQIEKELARVFLQKEGDEYINESQVETEDIVNRHLICVVCNKLTEGGNICMGCSTVIHSEFD